jgi:hypothetical protein
MTRNQRPTPNPDPTDYAHRHRVNVIGGITIVVLIGLAFVTAKLFFDHEKMESCIASGRRNCVDLGAPPREGIVIPVR